MREQAYLKSIQTIEQLWNTHEKGYQRAMRNEELYLKQILEEDIEKGRLGVEQANMFIQQSLGVELSDLGSGLVDRQRSGGAKKQLYSVEVFTPSKAANIVGTIPATLITITAFICFLTLTGALDTPLNSIVNIFQGIGG